MSQEYLLKRKVEMAIASYLRGLDSLSGLTIHEGSVLNENLDLPFIGVHGATNQNDDSMPYEAGCRIVTLVIEYQAHAADTNRSDFDLNVACLLYELEQQAEIRAAVNKTVDPDTRTLKGIHIYLVTLVNEDATFESDLWRESIQLSVKCGEVDAF